MHNNSLEDNALYEVSFLPSEVHRLNGEENALLTRTENVVD
jgi:hypothetical protein